MHVCLLLICVFDFLHTLKMVVRQYPWMDATGIVCCLQVLGECLETVHILVLCPQVAEVRGCWDSKEKLQEKQLQLAWCALRLDEIPERGNGLRDLDLPEFCSLECQVFRAFSSHYPRVRVLLKECLQSILLTQLQNKPPSSRSSESGPVEEKRGKVSGGNPWRCQTMVPAQRLSLCHMEKPLNPGTILYLELTSAHQKPGWMWPWDFKLSWESRLWRAPHHS